MLLSRNVLKYFPQFLIVVLIVVLPSSLCFGATCTTTSTTTWDCGTPGSNDDLIVNHDITISGNFTVNNGSITVNSPNTLTISGNLTFNNGSTVLVNSGGGIHVTGNFENKNGSNNIDILGSLTIVGNFRNGTGAGTDALINVGSTGTIHYGGSCSNPGDVTDGVDTFTGCDNSILPIELVFFRGNHERGVNILEWQTATEINNDFFSIERSQDARTWEEIAKVAGNGNSDVILDYQYRDERPLYGSNYYRLKQVDYDGKSEYFHIILIKTGDLPDLSIESTFPNPTTDELQVNYLSNNTIPIKLNIYDSNGLSVIKRDVENRPGFNQLVLSTDHLAPGIYLLLMENRGSHFSRKIVIY